MIRCENCETDNLEGSEYCDECGAKLPSAGARKPAFAREVPKGTIPEPASPSPASVSSASPPSPPPASASSASPPSPPPSGPSPAVTSMPEPMRTSVISEQKPTSVVGRLLGADQSPPTIPQPKAKLVIIRGGRMGKEFPLVEIESLVGRWDADNQVFPEVDLDDDDPEAKVSRRHARILYRDGQFFIEDLGSTNGTFINRSARLTPGHLCPIQSGDELIVGKTFLRFLIET